jgi:hypothetical protein
LTPLSSFRSKSTPRVRYALNAALNPKSAFCISNLHKPFSVQKASDETRMARMRKSTNSGGRLESHRSPLGTGRNPRPYVANVSPLRGSSAITTVERRSLWSRRERRLAGKEDEGWSSSRTCCLREAALPDRQQRGMFVGKGGPRFVGFNDEEICWLTHSSSRLVSPKKGDNKVETNASLGLSRVERSSCLKPFRHVARYKALNRIAEDLIA